MFQGDRVVCTNLAADTFHYFMAVKNLLTAFGFIVSIEVWFFFLKLSAYYSTKCTFQWC